MDNPQFVLLLFGFANAGVPFERIGPGTYYALAALLIESPLVSSCFRSAVDLLNQNVTSRGMCLRPCLAQAIRVE